MNKIILIAIAILLIVTAKGFAETTKEVRTNPVVVSATHSPTLYSEISRIVTIIRSEQIQNAPVKSIDQLLEFVASVDMRQRGGPNAQSDFSIRGGTFDQTLILLNGIPFNSPQTGHHNGNIPININDIERIEILEGSGTRVLGVNALSGGINIITKKSIDKNLINANISGGEYAFYDLGISAFVNPIENLKTYYSINKQKNDGYIDNTDTETLNAYGYNELSTGIGKFSLQFGANTRNFGANSFYTAAFPDQYEETTASFASLDFNNTTESYIVSSKVYINTHFDKFQLFRNIDTAPDWYKEHNFHLTNTLGGDFKISLPSSIGASSLGIELRSENIKSNVLGKLMEKPIKINGEENAEFTHEDTRDNIAIFAEQSIVIKDFSISIGALGNFNSDFSPTIYAGIDASLKLPSNISIFFSINQSGRLPNFTDLYYEGPTNKGNPNLVPEKSISFELGTKFIDNKWNLSFSIFHNRGTDLIDWVKMPDSTLWETQNLTSLNTTGLQSSATFYPNAEKGIAKFLKFINIGYTFIDSEKSAEEMESFFALDFLRHKFILTAGLDCGSGFGANINFSFQKRAGTYYNYKEDAEKPYRDVSLASARLFYEYSFLKIFIEADNIFDSRYQDIANIQQPGRWIRTGINLSI